MFTSGSYKACRRRTMSTITHATVVYQQIDNGNIANQIHRFTIDYGKFMLLVFKRGIQADDGSFGLGLNTRPLVKYY